METQLEGLQREELEGTHIYQYSYEQSGPPREMDPNASLIQLSTNDQCLGFDAMIRGHPVAAFGGIDRVRPHVEDLLVCGGNIVKFLRCRFFGRFQ